MVEFCIVSVQEYSPLSIVALVEVFLHQNDPHFMFVQVQLSDFMRTFGKTYIQWSSEVGHANLYKKMVSKNCKKNVSLPEVKTELHHDGVCLLH